MKNKKKLIIFIISIAVILFISLFFIYYYHESTLLTSDDKKWISNNGKKIIDIEVFNDVLVYGMDGEGIIFSFLDYVTEETELQFNKVPYLKEEGTSSDSYKIEILNGTSDLTSNNLFIYEDLYAAVSKKNEKFNRVTDFSNLTIGVLDSDASNISYYLKSASNIKYNNYSTGDDLFKALDENEVNLIIIPNILYLDKTIGNSDYYSIYYFTDIKKNIVFTLDNKNKELNNILKKYFNYWIENFYVLEYNNILLNSYLEKNNINDKTKAELLSKTYVYGYVENAPYEMTSNKEINGIAAEYINRIIRLTDIDFTFKKYPNIDSLNKAISNQEVDIYLDYNNIDNSKYLKTISPFVENYVVLGRISDDHIISTFESLKSNRVYMLDNNKSLYEYINTNAMVNIHTKNNIDDLVNSASNDKSLIIVDKEVYTYYRNHELVDYEILYSNIMSNDYSFMVKSDNDSFYRLFNYIINTNSYYKYRNNAYINLNTSIFDKASFEEVYLIILACILIPIILIIIIFVFIKNKHKLKLVKKEDRKKYTDLLTSLKNRNYLNLKIDEWNLNKVYPQSIVVVDLNNLKYINDNYGREKGDNLIIRAASILLNTQLENTEIIRTDGTEFLIYLVGYSEEQVDVYVKKIRKELKELPYEFGASLGYSMIFDNIKTIDDAINEAMIDLQVDKESYR